MGNKSSFEVSKKSAISIGKIPEPKIESSKSKVSKGSPRSIKPSKCHDPVDHFYVEPSEEDHIKVAVIGNIGVGKSSIITQYVEGKFVVNRDSTQGSLRFFNQNEEIFDEVKNLKIYDLIGNEEWSKIKYYLGVLEGLLIVFDLTDPKTFEHAKELCKLVKNESKRLNPPPEEEKGLQVQQQEEEEEFIIGVSLVGNKVDDVENRKVKKEEAESFALDLGFDYVETSAKDNINIKKAFINVLEQNSPYPL